MADRVSKYGLYQFGGFLVLRIPWCKKSAAVLELSIVVIEISVDYDCKI